MKENILTTVWSFPKRGDWATHNSKYRGNFAPQIPRTIIKRYSSLGELVLDPMVGGGTTGIECKLLGRNFIGRDINPESIAISKNVMKFDVTEDIPEIRYDIKIGDIRDLYDIENDSIDLIITHPPYGNIIKYSDGKIKDDLSNINDLDKFYAELETGIKELFRVLNPNHYCAILIGDTRRKKHYVPLAYEVMKLFLKNNFILKEDIIKVQHNCNSTSYWSKKAIKYNIFLIMHEHLFIFRKPSIDENIIPYRYSCFRT
ncbi:MAG: DNA methyltransferase [candidate division WOR-3 bacterium]|nr:DNA methyltransferase [candidate division WOR-3 bacterium]